MLGNIGVDILRDGCDLGTAIGIKGNGELLDLEVGNEMQIARRALLYRNGEYRRILTLVGPTDEIIVFLCGCGKGEAVGFNGIGIGGIGKGAAVQRVAYGVAHGRPFGGEGHFSVDAVGIKVPFLLTVHPAHEGIGCFCRFCGHGHECSVFARMLFNSRAADGVKGNGIGIDLPACNESHALGYGVVFKIPRLAVSHPADKGVSLLGGDRG